MSDQEVLSNKRKRIIQEIRDTEKVFLQAVESATSNYIQAAIKENVLTESESEILTQIQLPLDIIMGGSKVLIKELEQELNKQPNDICVGEILCNFVTDNVTSAFIRYISKYEELAMWILSFGRKEKQSHPFNLFMRKIQRKLRGNDLLYFLITPVQRPPRYLLLIRVTEFRLCKI